MQTQTVEAPNPVLASISQGHQIFLAAEKLQSTNWPEAEKLYEQAAEAGYIEGWYVLGQQTKRGGMHLREVHDALRCFNNAANHGHAPSMFEFALAYKTGWGVTQDDTKMFNWALKAAQSGYAQAQFSVGMLYAQGIGTPPSIEEAIFWLTRATDNGHPRSSAELRKQIRRL